MNSSQTKQRRYYFHDKALLSAKVFLVYYCKPDNTNVTMAIDGPFLKETPAIDKVKELLKKGYCAWVVTYND